MGVGFQSVFYLIYLTQVIMDVVFNHTAEGNENGPIFSFRGVDNTVYYMLAPKVILSNASLLTILGLLTIRWKSWKDLMSSSNKEGKWHLVTFPFPLFRFQGSFSVENNVKTRFFFFFFFRK